METEETKPWYEGLTDKQRRFVEEYCVDWNATQAAIRAGYSKNSANQQGPENLVKLGIRGVIDSYLAAVSMKASEALKLQTDVARTRLNDFLVVEKVFRVPKVRKRLSQIIDELKYQNVLDMEFIARANLDKKEEDALYSEKQTRDLQILRYQIELEHNPNAFRDVDGVGEWVEEARPDLVALARAKEQGSIKSISFGKYGPKVETYAADAAQRNILEYYGKLPASGNTTNVVIFQLPDNGR